MRPSVTWNGALRRADHADRDGVRVAERVADRHHPVARPPSATSRRTSLRAAGGSASRSAGSARCRSARSRADHLGRDRLIVVSSPKSDTSILVASSTTWLLVRMRPSLLMMKPVPAARVVCSRGAGCCRGRPGRCRRGRPGRPAAAAGPPKKRWKRSSGAAAAAAEEVGQVLRLRLHLGPDVDDHRRAAPWRCCGRSARRAAPVSGALFIGGTASVCADEAGVRSSRDAITMPTASDDDGDQQRVEQRGLAGGHRTPPCYTSARISVCSGPVTAASRAPTIMLISVRTPKSSK